MAISRMLVRFPSWSSPRPQPVTALQGRASGAGEKPAGHVEGPLVTRSLEPAAHDDPA